MRKKLLLGWALALSILFPVFGLELVPTPKQLQTSGKDVTLGPEWTLSGNSAAVGYLRETLGEECSWKERPGAPTKVSFTQFQNSNPEAYRLRIAPGEIECSAASDAGFYRAVGRLAGIIALNGKKAAGGALTLPELEITDYPDFARRALMLQMSFQEKMSDADRFLMIERSIEAAARLGYNTIILEVGGNFNSPHNKSTRPHGWSAAELRQLVAFCRKRGLEAIPGTNVIGHMERAPHIFPIKNEKGRMIGMDVRNPEFFKQYEAVMDDLLDIFDNPAYFHLGGDEAMAAFKQLAATPEEGAQLYADTINRIQAYLEKKHCKAIIWHDMLFDQKDLPRQEGARKQWQGREPANGAMTSGAKTKLDKSIIVTYWCYHPRTIYRGVDLLRKANLETWVAPWKDRPGIEALLEYGARHGVKSVSAVLWQSSWRAGAPIVMVGAKAWNLKAPLPDRPDRLFFRLYAPDLTRIPESAKPLAFHDAAPDQPGVEITPVKNPDDLPELQEKDPGIAALVRVPGVPAEGVVIPHINVHRDANFVVLYTPAFGRTTRTNAVGDSYTWGRGQITAVDFMTADIPIPRGGAVISLFRGARTPGDWLENHLTLHREAEFAAISLKKSVREKIITAPLPADTRGVLVQLGVDHTLYGYGQFWESKFGAMFSIVFTDGSRENLRLSDMCAVLPSLSDEGKFATAPADTSRFWVRWDRTGEKKVKSLELKIGRLGLMEDLKVYSGVCWE